MARIMLSYTLLWVRLGYRIWRGAIHWLLRGLPMSATLRHHIAGVVVMIPYLWVVWGVTIAFDFTWRADVIIGVITAGMLCRVYPVEAARAAW